MTTDRRTELARQLTENLRRDIEAAAQASCTATTDVNGALRRCWLANGHPGHHLVPHWWEP